MKKATKFIVDFVLPSDTGGRHVTHRYYDTMRGALGMYNYLVGSYMNILGKCQMESITNGARITHESGWWCEVIMYTKKVEVQS